MEQAKIGPYEFVSWSLAAVALLWTATTHANSALRLPGWPFVGAFASTASLALFAAATSTRLPRVAKHLYNLHYLAIAPLALATWSLDLAGGFAPTHGPFRSLAGGFLAAGVFWVGACLAATPCVRPSNAFRAGVVGGCILAMPYASASFAGAFLMMFAVLVASIPHLWRGFGAAPPKPIGGAVDALLGSWGFIAVNLCVLATLGQLVAAILWPMFSGVLSTTGGTIRATPLAELPYASILIRAERGLAGAALAGAATMLWPTRNRPFAPCAAAACAIAAFLPDGHDTLGTVLAAALLVLATGVFARIPLATRWPALSIAAAVGCLAGMETWRVPAGRVFGPTLALPILAEGALLVALGAVAYLWGMRKLPGFPA